MNKFEMETGYDEDIDIKHEPLEDCLESYVSISNQPTQTKIIVDFSSFKVMKFRFIH